MLRFEEEPNTKDSEATVIFAAKAYRRPVSNSTGVRLETQNLELAEEELKKNDTEFDWQGESDGMPPSRKRMLCFSLRRLFRLRKDQSFRAI